MYVSAKNILVVGIADQSGTLRELPVRVLAMDSRAEAIRCLRAERIDTVISHWRLMDCPDGQLLEGVREAKPATPTIAFVEPGNVAQEVAARGLGVDAVLSEDVDAEYFKEAVCQLLNLPAVASITQSSRDGPGLGSRVSPSGDDQQPMSFQI